MRTLDRYIVRSFLANASLFFVAMMLLRIIGDLFINIDEFAELEFATVGERILHVVRYYGYQSLSYFIELGGIIIVVSATFTLAVMNHTNELTAMLAAGVSMHRVALPIVICAMAMGGLVIVDQELIIPNVAGELVLSRDDRPDTVEFEVRLMTDANDSVWHARKYNAGQKRMGRTAVLMRDDQYHLMALLAGSQAQSAKRNGRNGWLLDEAHLIGTSRLGTIWVHKQDYQKIWTDVSPRRLLEACAEAIDRNVPLAEITRAVDVMLKGQAYGVTLRAELFEPSVGASWPQQQWGGKLSKPVFTFAQPDGRPLGSFLADEATWKISPEGEGYWKLTNGRFFYPCDLTPENLVLRESGNWSDYMSTSDLSRLIEMRKVADRRATETIKHSRFTAPINNLIMLLLGLPFILSRERNIRASASLCMLTVATFFTFIFICRYMGLSPLLGAWLPIFLFGPIAIIMFDSVKT